jgi:hypothetical protein
MEGVPFPGGVGIKGVWCTTCWRATIKAKAGNQTGWLQAGYLKLVGRRTLLDYGIRLLPMQLPSTTVDLREPGVLQFFYT